MKKRPWFLACLAFASILLLAFFSVPALAAHLPVHQTRCESQVVQSKHIWKLKVCQDFTYVDTAEGTVALLEGAPGIKALRLFLWFWIPSSHLCNAWVSQQSDAYVVIGKCDGSVYSMTGRALTADIVQMQYSVPVKH